MQVAPDFLVSKDKNEMKISDNDNIHMSLQTKIIAKIKQNDNNPIAIFFIFIF